jgi:hypothetical protein
MEVVAALVASVAGAMGALLWLDLSAEMPIHAALARMTVGGVTSVAVLFVLPLGVLLGMATTGTKIPSEWFAVGWLAIGVIAAPVAAAFVTGRYQPGRRSWVIEWMAIAWGVLAWLHIVRQVAVVFLLVGLGPAAVPGAVWQFPYTGLRLDQLAVGALVITAIPGIGFVGLRVRQWKGRRTAALVSDGLFGLMLLAAAYRLPAALVLLVLLALGALGRPRLGRRWVWATIVALSILPIDVSFQHGARGGPGFLPTMKGDFVSLDAFLHGPRHGYVVLDTGSHQTLYYEPRWVWAW